MISGEFGWESLLASDAPSGCGLKAALFTTYDRADEGLLVEHLLPLLLKLSREPDGEGPERQYFLLELDRRLKQLHDRLVVVSSTVREEPEDAEEGESGTYAWIWRSIRHLTVGSRRKAVQHAKLWLLHWGDSDEDSVEYLEIVVSSTNLTRAAFRGQLQGAWRACIELRSQPSQVRLASWGMLPQFLTELAASAGDNERLANFTKILARADCPDGVEFVASVPGTHSRQALRRTPWGAAGLGKIAPTGQGTVRASILSPYIGSWSADGLARWCSKFDGAPDRLALAWIDKDHPWARAKRWILPDATLKTLVGTGATLLHLRYDPLDGEETDLFHEEHRPSDDRWSHAKLYSLRRGSSRRLLITSANFSTAAWGVEGSDGNLAIENFELGVCVTQAAWPLENLEPFDDTDDAATVSEPPCRGSALITWARAAWDGKTVRVDCRCEPEQELAGELNSSGDWTPITGWTGSDLRSARIAWEDFKRPPSLIQLTCADETVKVPVMRRWEDELLSHVAILQECAPALDVDERQVKARKVGRLRAGTIQVVKHSYAASDFNLACDLLIIDEAHRAKGDNTAFSSALKRQKKYARRVLILTATPFSIRLDELQRMLALIGGDAARGSIGAFSRALDDLYGGSTTRSPDVVAERLAVKAKAAVDALGPFVIRHGIDDLRCEQTSFGGRADWNIVVPPAKLEELELMVRMDRSLRVAKSSGSESTKATNDPRFHVGWRHFDGVWEKLKREVMHLAQPAKAVVEHQLKHMKNLRNQVGVHSKMSAVAAVVEGTIMQGEKVILFCHHHATAQELTAHLASVLSRKKLPGLPSISVWRKAWNAPLLPAGELRHEAALRDTFIEWLCADLIRTQTWNWLHPSFASGASLLEAIKKTRARHPQGPETIVDAAQRLYHALLQSKSSRAVLKEAEDWPELLPGANGSSRVLGVCLPSDDAAEKSLFIHNQQPDTVISIFNSPFGPDALVVTDKLSEGIDLHRCCCRLIHYELDPSPIRTVQRNGRLRRVSSWAAATGQDILYAYPAFRGTRDHRLVQIMKKRINSFSLLLGGVQDFDVEDVVGSEEKWRNDVIAIAKGRLAAIGGQLRAREPGTQS